jgi:predicted dehydrogenase
MSATPVRIGLVGYGHGGRFFHSPLIERAPECELAAVATRSPDRRAELQKDHPGVPVYDDLAGLAGAGVDAVVISTPVQTHLALVGWSSTPGTP